MRLDLGSAAVHPGRDSDRTGRARVADSVTPLGQWRRALRARSLRGLLWQTARHRLAQWAAPPLPPIRFEIPLAPPCRLSSATLIAALSVSTVRLRTPAELNHAEAP